MLAREVQTTAVRRTDLREDARRYTISRLFLWAVSSIVTMVLFTGMVMLVDETGLGDARLETSAAVFLVVLAGLGFIVLAAVIVHTLVKGALSEIEIRETGIARCSPHAAEFSIAWGEVDRIEDHLLGTRLTTRSGRSLLLPEMLGGYIDALTSAGQHLVDHLPGEPFPTTFRENRVPLLVAFCGHFGAVDPFGDGCPECANACLNCGSPGQCSLFAARPKDRARSP